MSVPILRPQEFRGIFPCCSLLLRWNERQKGPQKGSATFPGLAGSRDGHCGVLAEYRTCELAVKKS